MLKNIDSLKIKIIILLSLLIIFLTVLLSCVYIDNINSLVKSNIIFIHKNMIVKEKKELQNKIDLVFNIIKMYYEKSTPKYMEKVVKKSLISHQEQLFSQLNHIYNINKNKVSDKQMKTILKNIVKYARYDGNGYFWINDMNYKMIMHPIKPRYNGKIFINTPKVPFVQLGVDAIKKYKTNEEFIKYRFYNPSTKKYEFKVSLVRVFEPYKWIIGTGRYLSDVTPIVKKQLIEDIKALRYGHNGYFWIADMNYKMIMHPIKPRYNGKIFINTPKVPFVQLGVDAIKKTKKDEDFIRYKFYDNVAKTYEEKLSVIKLFKPWGWIVGTGVCIHNVKKSIHRIKLLKTYEEKNLIKKILLITICIILLTLVLAYYLIGKFISEPIKNLTSEKKYFKEISEIDFLTNILNRRSFFEKLGRYSDIAKNNNIFLGIMMVDIDHFKSINDLYGHDGGDEVLRQMSKIIRACLRKDDLFGRLGGEEFCLCVFDSDKETLLKIAQKIRVEIEKTIVEHNSNKIKFTISIGCYHFDTSLEKHDVALQKADKALYKAKNRGRNRIEIYN